MTGKQDNLHKISLSGEGRSYALGQLIEIPISRWYALQKAADAKTETVYVTRTGAQLVAWYRRKQATMHAPTAAVERPRPAQTLLTGVDPNQWAKTYRLVRLRSGSVAVRSSCLACPDIC